MTSERTAATDGHDSPVYTQAPHAPWREILRHRWSGRRDRALVLCDREGGYHVLSAARRRWRPRGLTALPAVGVLRESAPPVRMRGGYENAFHVRLTEESGTRDVGLPTEYGTELVDVHATWWVHDPEQVVRTRTRYGWDTVRKDLERRLQHLHAAYEAEGRRLDTPHVLHHLSGTSTLDGTGLSYRVTDVSPRAVPGELRLGRGAETGVPLSWSAHTTADYEFCLRAVRNGPATLAALWLVRRPDEIERVLNWTVDHPELVHPRAGGDGVAAVLGQLSEQELQALAEVLRHRITALGHEAPRPGDDGPGQPVVGADGMPR
ncbi:hypothetical protein ACGH2B_11935 [Streptomyces sp. BBFR2]|uniref:hypothetical protein n=1 Tax=Streptomyces sp. BBFR2 TaxID=3372854 RepID=UPI0037D9947B